MQADIITIGNEILIGQIVDTNSAWIADQLISIGISIRQITSISDQEEHILHTLKYNSKYSDVLILTGGIGPTRDDRTKNTICKYFNSKLVINNEALQRIKKFLASRGGKMNTLNKKQAEMPDNCIILPNHEGTASGMWFEKEGVIYIFLPGVPFEMKLLIEQEVLPRLSQYFSFPAMINTTVLIQGIAEAHLAQMLKSWEKNLPSHLHLAYLPSPGYIRLRLGGKGQNKDELERIITQEIEKLYEIIPDNILSATFDKPEILLGETMKKMKKTLATAESCTGGNIGHLITSVPGSSEYYLGGIIAYSNEIKEKMLGVNTEDIVRHGAVSKQVVEQMAQGVRKMLEADYAIATSGIAGPSEGTKEKPVGTTWIAVASNKKVIARQFLFGSLRETNIMKASVTGLSMLIKLIESL